MNININSNDYLEESNHELFLLKQVLIKQPSVIEDIENIKQGYQLLTKAVYTSKKNVLEVIDPKLNKQYQELVRIVKSSYENFEAIINEAYGTDSPQSLPSFYIDPHIFGDYPYFPFASIFEKPLDSWDEIENKLNESLNRINQGYALIDIKDNKTSHANFFNEVEKYLTSFFKFTCGDLVIDLEIPALIYKNGTPLPIQLKRKEIQFLILLLRNKGNLVSYKAVAETLDTNYYHPGIDNLATGEKLRLLKNDLGKMLLQAGMNRDTFKQMITTHSTKGYVLNCTT